MTIHTPRDRPELRARTELVRYEPVADVAILAAIGRAVLHAPYRDYAYAQDIAEHLGFLPNAHTSRCLHPRLAALVKAGSACAGQRDRHRFWTLTDSGREQVAAEAPALPEAPQHRCWRHSRAIAAEQMPVLRNRLRTLLGEVGELEEAQATRVDEAAWRESGERLAQVCEGLGEATFCLHQWPEPDDHAADAESRRLDAVLPPLES